MKIRYLKRNQIDAARWDALIKCSPDGRPYAYSWHLDIVADDWHALVLNDYEAVMPLPTNRKLFGFRQIFNPFFSQQLGIFGGQSLSENTVIAFIEALPPSFRKIILYLHSGTPALSNFSVKERTNYVLNIERPYDEIHKGYSRNLRRNLKVANEIHTLLEAPLSVADFVTLHRQRSEELFSIPRAAYQRLEELMDAYLERDMAAFLGATNSSGRLLACGFFPLSHGRVFNPACPALPEGRTTYSIHWITDQVIQRYAEKMERFDFEGSDLPGVAAFFQRFSPVNEPYFVFERRSFPFTLIGK